MPARTIQESLRFRELVDAALDAGVTKPVEILEWIEKHKKKKEAAPSLTTITRILREKGYEPTGYHWVQKEGQDASN